MAGIRSTNTNPEMLLRRGLHAIGWRYRLHHKGLPGRPDLVFPARKAAIFANGCFWHGHDCPLFKWPKTRQEFWRNKIEGNIERDHRVREQLRAMDWRVADVWECALKGPNRKPLEAVLRDCNSFLLGNLEYVTISCLKESQSKPAAFT